MGTVLIKNVRAVLPDRVTDGTDLLIENGKISDVDLKGAVPKDTEVINGLGGLLTAGFIDLHVHGGGGADFMDATADAFRTVTKAHLKRGTTALVPTAMTASEEDLLRFINAYHEFKKDPCDGAFTPGVHLEGPYFSGANGNSKGAQKGDLLRLPDEGEMRRLIAAAKGDILRWDAAPELENTDMFARVCRENGIMPAIAHTAATSEQALNGIQNGFAHVTHFYNACTTYRKEGQKVLAGVVEAAYLSDDVTVELIGDGCHIPRDILRLALKIKGAEKVSIITDATRISCTDLRKGMLGSLKNGTEVIVHDGVAKLPDMSCFAGSIATSDRCFRVLVNDYGIDLCTASKMMSLAPAKVLGLDSMMGSIEVGKNADLVLLNRELTVDKVILGGKTMYYNHKG